MGLESANSAGISAETPISGGASTFSYLPGSSQAGGTHAAGGIVNMKAAETADPYYRPPRPRRTTIENELSQPQRTRGSIGSADWANQRWSHHSPDLEGSPMRAEGPTISRRGTPVPVHLGGNRENNDSDAEDPRTSKTDYATREVDFYYGVRGPALSNLPTRRLKTGPADPTGPVSSASGWLKGLFGGKTKETGKGFEVVRSSRAPPTTGRRAQSGAMATAVDAPYTDDPNADQQPERSRGLALSDEGDAIGAGTRHLPDDEAPSPLASDDERSDDGSVSDDEEWEGGRRRSQISPFPPTLPTIETPGGIELPSRIASKASSKHPSSRPTRDNTQRSRAPTVPRKSSRRDSSTDLSKIGQRLSTVDGSPANTPRQSARLQAPPGSVGGSRIPFESHQKTLSHGTTGTSHGTHLSAGSSIYPPSSGGVDDDVTGHARHSSSVFGGFDRPSSMGYVQQHRASDNIHTASPHGPSLIGSSAELVDDPRRTPSPEIGHAM